MKESIIVLSNPCIIIIANDVHNRFIVLRCTRIDITSVFLLVDNEEFQQSEVVEDYSTDSSMDSGRKLSYGNE